MTLFVESVICIILATAAIWSTAAGSMQASSWSTSLLRSHRLAHHAVSMLIEKTSRGKASLNRITELLDAPIDVADRPVCPT